MKGDKAMEEYMERYERSKAKISELNAEAEAEARRDRIQRMTRKYEAGASPRDEKTAKDDSYYPIERNYIEWIKNDYICSIINKDPILRNISYKLVEIGLEEAMKGYTVARAPSPWAHTK